MHKGRPMQPFAGKLYTVKQVADILQVSPATVRNRIEDGSIQAIELPTRPGATRKQYRIKGIELDRLLGLDG